MVEVAVEGAIGLEGRGGGGGRDRMEEGVEEEAVEKYGGGIRKTE